MTAQDSCVVVVGFGNPLAGDDGVGVILLEILQHRFRFVPTVELLEAGIAGPELLTRICQARHLIALDAYQNDAPPGTVTVEPLSALTALGRGRAMAHDAGLAELLDSADLLGRRPPGVLIGVEPRVLESGLLGLSKEVRDAIPELIQSAVAHLQSIGVMVVRD